MGAVRAGNVRLAKDPQVLCLQLGKLERSGLGQGIGPARPVMTALVTLTLRSNASEGSLFCIAALRMMTSILSKTIRSLQL